MAAITTGSFAKALFPGVNKFYGTEYKRKPLVSSRVFEQEKSRKNYEEDVATSGFGLAPDKPEGSPISYDSARQLWVTRYTHVVSALGFLITREMYDDDLYGVIGKKRSQALATAMRETRETKHANILNRAFNSSYTGGDGLELCSTAHLLDGGTFSNELATAADLSEASLEQACIDIMNFVDARSLKANISPKALVIPNALKFEAIRILKSALQSDTANNAINALKSSGDIDEIITWSHLTDTDAWFVKTDCPDGLKTFNRVALEFSPVENDFDTENARFKAYERYSMKWSDPRTVYGSPGA